MSLLDHRGVELHRRLSGAEQFDTANRAKPAAIIEPETRCEAIERGGLHLRAARLGRAEQRRRNDITGGRQPRHGMQRWRVIGETRPTRQFPISVVADLDTADLTGSSFLERQRPAQFDVADFDRGGIRPTHPCRGQRHLDDRCARQHRNPFDGVIGEPWQDVGIEMIDPGPHRPGCLKPISGWSKGGSVRSLASVVRSNQNRSLFHG